MTKIKKKDVMLGTFTGTGKDVMNIYKLIGEIKGISHRSEDPNLAKIIDELDEIISRSLIPF